MWSVASLDQPCGDGGGALRDVVALPQGDDDPAAELERKTVRDLLNGLTEETVASMDETELARVRARLAAEGVLPSTSRSVA